MIVVLETLVVVWRPYPLRRRAIAIFYFLPSSYLAFLSSCCRYRRHGHPYCPHARSHHFVPRSPASSTSDGDVAVSPTKTVKVVLRAKSSRLLARRAVVPSRSYLDSTNSALGVCLPMQRFVRVFAQGAVENLDTFFTNMYKYYHSRGLLSIVSTGVAHLLILAFTVRHNRTAQFPLLAPIPVFWCINADVGTRFHGSQMQWFGVPGRLRTGTTHYLRFLVRIFCRVQARSCLVVESPTCSVPAV